MKIRYLPLYPFFQDNGGAKRHAVELIKGLRNNGFEIEALDFSAEKIDFSVLIVFGFFIHDPEIIKYCRSKNVKIVLIPLFDPMYHKTSYKILYNLGKIFPLQNTAKIRTAILENCDIIIANNTKEKNDIQEIFKIDPTKIKVNYVGLTSYFFEKADKISENLFYNEYKLKDFVFYPSAGISKRKNQISLLKAVKNTDIKLVLTGYDHIEKDIEKSFYKLTKNNKNVICLGKLSEDMLISAYKNAKVMVSVSLAETAGLINLEAGYLGCNLVVTKSPVFKEYLKDYAIYVNSKDVKSIRRGIETALSKDKDSNLRNFISARYSWKKYCENFIAFLKEL